MSSWSHIAVSEADRCLVVRIDRPSSRNALNTALMSELTEVARQNRRSSRLRAIILTGTETFFSAGLDLVSVTAERKVSAANLLELRAAVMAGPDMCRAWDDIEVPTLAAIEGFCIGGGVSLALACDFRIMGRNAYLRLPEVPLGINMSWRTLPRLASLAGASRAKRIAMFGEALPAETCELWGLADAVVENGFALEEAHTWASKLVDLPPLPIQMTKEAINAAANANHHASTFMDRDQFLLTYGTEDFKEGVAAWLDKRPPLFSGN